MVKNRKISISMLNFNKAKRIISLVNNYNAINRCLEKGKSEGMSKKEWKEYEGWASKRKHEIIKYLSSLEENEENK
jgi:hypothetical protein